MRLKYTFIAKHQSIYSVTRMCRVLRLHPGGYYAWKAQPQSQRAIDDECLLSLLKQAWLESGGVYGYRKLTLDMRGMGEQCSRHRVATAAALRWHQSTARLWQTSLLLLS